MSNVTPPPGVELPTSRSLVRSTLIALGVAVFVLVGFVLPGEYGVDPTGIGRVFGLTEMGRIKVVLARDAAAEDAALAARGSASRDAAPATALPADTTAGDDLTSAALPVEAPAAAPTAAAEQVTRVVLAPGEGKEVKLVMAEGGRATYSWATDRGVVNYDTHADAPGIDYHGYAKGTGVPSDAGVLVAAFDGKHGWFWRNRTSKALTVTLRTSGDVQEIVGP